MTRRFAFFRYHAMLLFHVFALQSSEQRLWKTQPCIFTLSVPSPSLMPHTRAFPGYLTPCGGSWRIRARGGGVRQNLTFPKRSGCIRFKLLGCLL